MQNERSGTIFCLINKSANGIFYYGILYIFITISSVVAQRPCDTSYYCILFSRLPLHYKLRDICLSRWLSCVYHCTEIMSKAM